MTDPKNENGDHAPKDETDVKRNDIESLFRGRFYNPPALGLDLDEVLEEHEHPGDVSPHRAPKTPSNA